MTSKVYRQVPGSATTKLFIVDVAAIKKNQKADFVLQPYDIIEVAEAGMFSLSNWPDNVNGGVDRRHHGRDLINGNITCRRE